MREPTCSNLPTGSFRPSENTGSIPPTPESLCGINKILNVRLYSHVNHCSWPATCCNLWCPMTRSEVLCWASEHHSAPSSFDALFSGPTAAETIPSGGLRNRKLVPDRSEERFLRYLWAWRPNLGSKKRTAKIVTFSGYQLDHPTKAAKALMEFTQWRSSVGKPKPSPRKTCPKCPWQLEHKISQPQKCMCPELIRVDLQAMPLQAGWYPCNWNETSGNSVKTRQNTLRGSLTSVKDEILRASFGASCGVRLHLAAQRHCWWPEGRIAFEVCRLQTGWNWSHDIISMWPRGIRPKSWPTTATIELHFTSIPCSRTAPFCFAPTKQDNLVTARQKEPKNDSLRLLPRVHLLTQGWLLFSSWNVDKHWQMSSTTHAEMNIKKHCFHSGCT